MLLTKTENPRFPSESEEFKHTCFGPDLQEALNSDRNPQVLVEQLIKEHAKFPEIYTYNLKFYPIHRRAI